jgi:retron-type reverse transcriptase
MLKCLNVVVVDIDLSKFFDRIHHDRLIARQRCNRPSPK